MNEQTNKQKFIEGKRVGGGSKRKGGQIRGDRRYDFEC